MIADPDLLRAALAAPWDAAPRLVLADWVQEHDADPLVAAALRVAGQWHVDDEGYAWEFSVEAILPAGIHLHEYTDEFEDYGHAVAVKAYMAFDGIPDPPACKSCGSTKNLEWPDRRFRSWRCFRGHGCRVVNHTNPHFVNGLGLHYTEGDAADFGDPV